MTALVYLLGVVLFFLGVVASIALHEVGHMVPAKRFGVKVTQYFVGFGKTVWSTKRGDTEYGVKMFPLGGFIRMIGMLPPEKRDANGKVKGFTGGVLGKLIADARAVEYEHVTAEDQDRLFYKKAWWKKVIVMSGGPMMNVFLAVAILGAVFMLLGISKPTLTVSQVSDCVQPASTATAVCKPTDPASPARTAGFRAGDQVLSVDGTAMTSWDQFSHVIRDSVGKRIAVVVDRGGRQLTLHADPTVNRLFSLEDPTRFVQAGFLGVSPGQVREQQSFGFVLSTIGSYTEQTGKALVSMPSRLVGVAKAAVGLEDRDPRSPMSVVGASRVAGEVASNDQIDVVDRLATLLMLLGVVNLFVALFNFVPLLPLDGGHIAGALYEAVRRAWARLRRRPDPGYADVAQMLPVAYVAASILVVLGVLLIWTDIVNPIRLTG
ncbi:MAG: site-2 protease family protein [Nocardioidaceae bacterium]